MISVTIALCSQLPTVTDPIERAFVSLGMREAVCEAYTASIQLLRDDPIGTCTSTLFGALIFATVALLLLGANQMVHAKKDAISRFNGVTPMIFGAAGIYFGMEARSPELGTSGEWSAIASVFFLCAAIMTTGIPLITAWSRHRSRPV